ncbi:hypothetical protein GM418_10660 [Maribellus comscasis]|uniref:Fibrobacter succinogenes major paralogous domain-containing protein n=1 Tax=Maribellus comscasis TaxID=2681766 RepID=A0A6I6JNS5_9BACT|nr:FISUMP domain-containing protein [Maribellus comscasis]QGY44101.1 hypothetical protein GM418_10660 [Maribellus comscasis]
MKKIFQIFLFVFLVIIMVQCRKEKMIGSDPIELSYIVTDVSAYAAYDGAINLSVTGGIPPYGFFWSNGEVTEDIDSLDGGIYVIIVTDKLHQIKADTIEVLQPDPDSIILRYEINYPTTNEGNDGSVILTVKGGYPPYSYLWSTGSQSKDIFGLSADLYTVTVTDSLGLTRTDTISLQDFIVDVEGNSYGTITIGNQTWMKQNLRVQHTAGGEEVESFVYRNRDSLAGSYGRLYTWEAAMNGSNEDGAQGICPDGWHIPTDEEYKILEMALGMTQQDADKSNTWRGTDVGTKLKFGGSSGFDALLSGRMKGDETYSYMDKIEYLWTSTESGSEKAWQRTLDKDADDIGRFNSAPKNYAFSVRCLKNDN